MTDATPNETAGVTYKQFKWNIAVAAEWRAASGNLYATDTGECIYIPAAMGADIEEATICGEFVLVGETDRLGGSAGAAAAEEEKL